MAIQLLIADDHEVIRAGLKGFFQGTDIHIAAEASGGKEALSLVMRHNFDVALLDIHMPEGDGLSYLAQIKQAQPDMPVVMFSQFDNPTYLARAVALGASGFLLKSVSQEAVVDAIYKAAKGAPIWTREELRRVHGTSTTPHLDTDLEVPLTKRENQVLRQLAFGLANKEIAQSLGVSYETVKEHVQHILRKVGVSDRTQAAIWAVRKGLV